MPLVSFASLAAGAQAGAYAVPLFLAPELLAAEGMLAAAEERRAPLGIGLYGPWVERPRVAALAAGLRALAEGASVPVALMLDHGPSLEACVAALRLGFSDVMFDGSRLPLEENIAATRLVARVAHAAGAGVEAELGRVGSGSDYAREGARGVGFTEPESVARFVEGTGVDLLAVAFGSAHGVYQGEPHLDLELLEALRACTPTPLVMHGGSGLSEAQFRGAIARGICKINVFTELAQTTGERVTALARGERPSYMALQDVIRDTFRERCGYYLDLFGATGRACGEGMG